MDVYHWKAMPSVWIVMHCIQRKELQRHIRNKILKNFEICFSCGWTFLILSVGVNNVHCILKLYSQTRCWTYIFILAKMWRHIRNENCFTPKTLQTVQTTQIFFRVNRILLLHLLKAFKIVLSQHGLNIRRVGHFGHIRNVTSVTDITVFRCS